MRSRDSTVFGASGGKWGGLCPSAIHSSCVALHLSNQPVTTCESTASQLFRCHTRNMACDCGCAKLNYPDVYTSTVQQDILLPMQNHQQYGVLHTVSCSAPP